MGLFTMCLMWGSANGSYLELDGPTRVNKGGGINQVGRAKMGGIFNPPRDN